MTTPVLVVDANREFGILIRQSLEETGQYRVRLSTSGAEALQLVQQQSFDLAIIDFDLPDLSGDQVVHELRKSAPRLRMIAIPVSGRTEELARLPLQGVLPRPFYLPELPAVIEKALSEPEAGAEPGGPTAPSAGRQAAPAATRRAAPEADLPLVSPQLERMLEQQEGNPLAALVLKGKRLLTGAGLPARQLEDVAGVLIARDLVTGGPGAVAQYIRTAGSSEDQLVYSTTLPWDSILAVLFPFRTTFGTVRAVTDSLGRLLLDPKALSQPLAARPQTETAVVAPPALELPKDWHPSESPSAGQRAFLDDITRFELPPPKPTAIEHSAITEEPSPSMGLPKDWIPKDTPPEAFIAIVESPPAQDLEPRHVSVLDALRQEAAYYLPFTAVLIPRLPDNRLEDELARKIATWVENFCVAWDWRADEIEVQPQYLAITVSLIPESAPAHAVEQLRDDLSRRVFEEHPEFLRRLPSGRFWARSYLLSAGRAPEKSEIRRFIDHTRRAQGLRG